MKRLSLLAGLLAAGLLLSASPLAAQQPRLSPHETTSTVVHGDRVMVVYGRPYMKGRKTWGGPMIPYGEVWRTGADEATLLVTEQPIVMGGTTIPAGAYTLWTLPKADGSAQLIVNKQIGQWGIKGHNAPANYDASRDAARVDLEKKTLDQPVEQFTIAIKRSGVITLSWDNTEYSVPFSVAK